MSSRYRLGLPTFALRNIIKNEFCFFKLQRTSRGEAETSHLLFQKRKGRRSGFCFFFHVISLARFGLVSYKLRSFFSTCQKKQNEGCCFPGEEEEEGREEGRKKRQRGEEVKQDEWELERELS